VLKGDYKASTQGINGEGLVIDC